MSLFLNELNFKKFDHIVLNHGTNQNHAHLHMKITVKPNCINDEIDCIKSDKKDWFGRWMKQTACPEHFDQFTKINVI